jgi:hypothetical protein
MGKGVWPMTLTPAEGVKIAVENLYTVFARYPLNTAMDACPHCVNEREQEQLTGLPLRALSVKDVRHYSFNAISTWGDVRDFKHFLPRLLDLLAFHNLNDSLLLAKFEYADWENWKKTEVEATEAYLRALWRFTLSDYPSPTITPYDFIFGAGRVLPDFAPYVDYWRNNLSQASLRHLAILIQLDMHHVRRIPELQSWLSEKATRDSLENAFFSDPEFENEFSWAVEVLEYNL